MQSNIFQPASAPLQIPYLRGGERALRAGWWVLLFIIITISCRPEEEIISSSGSLSLQVSSDTVLFDTLLTDRGSISRRFRIYNPNKGAVRLDRIALAKGSQSDYSLIINGREGTELRDELLFGKDSLQVLVSAFIDPRDENTPYLVKDSVNFEWNGNSGHVKLVAYGQDAVFVNGDTLCNVTWTKDRPYVIYNYALIDSLCVLNVDPGAQIFLDNDAALLVKGSLKSNGTPDERVTIKNTRFDFRYKQAPGQWDAIYFLEGSGDNEIRFTDILNGTVGLRIGTPDDDFDFDIEVSNSTIGHMSAAGILAFTSEVRCTNTLIYNAGNFLIGNFAGGTYQYDHCTLVNSPNYFVRDDPSVQFSNFIELSDGTLLADPISVTIRNSIIWGTEANELGLYDAGVGFNTDFSNGILKSDRPINGFFGQPALESPGFLNAQLFDYRLDSLSLARDAGQPIGITDDLLGTQRDLHPDIGCYEYHPTED